MNLRFKVAGNGLQLHVAQPLRGVEESCDRVPTATIDAEGAVRGARQDPKAPGARAIAESSRGRTRAAARRGVGCEVGTEN